MKAGDAGILDMLAQALGKLGAPAGQARVMAAQVLKRARQLATESGSSETEALAGLLARIVAGRRGEYGIPAADGAAHPGSPPRAATKPDKSAPPSRRHATPGECRPSRTR